VAPSAHAYLPIDRRSTDSRRTANLDATSRVVARACAASALGLGVLAYSQGRWTGYYLELLFASSVPGDVAEYRVTTPGTPLLTFITPRIPCVRDSTHARTHTHTLHARAPTDALHHAHARTHAHNVARARPLQLRSTNAHGPFLARARMAGFTWPDALPFADCHDAQCRGTLV
jgi:hypothetical protein